MTSRTYFRASSYATVACGALALAVAGGAGLGLLVAFTCALAAGWALEGRRWQLSERTGLVVVVLSLPLFYFDWKYQTGGGASLLGGGDSAADGPTARGGVAALVHLTLFLSSVKLLQAKADRDWLFLYLISFFQVLLAAGLSLSPAYMVVLALYTFCVLLAVVCFEVSKARRRAPEAGEVRLLAACEGDRRVRRWASAAASARGLPMAALCLLALTFSLALPIFFIMPRGGAAAMSLAAGAPTATVGFSERVTLGEIGRLQQNDAVVMRVRVDEPPTGRNQNLRWRGVALDRFDGRAWGRSSAEARAVLPGERDFYQLGTTEHESHLTTQSFFVEPLDTPVLFAAPRAVAVQGALPYVRRDREGTLTTAPHSRERLSYRAYSDTVDPSTDVLRADDRPYSPEARRHLALPNSFDTRIASLAYLVVSEAGARNRYDAARAVEAHLAAGGIYGYSLDMKAGGADPLASFLFDVKEGHCEYFATAMAVMLRSQGVAARLVNGFQSGEYNETAGAYIVRQSDAHSWVEVYFPATNSWVTFDPTPPAGRIATAARGWSSTSFGKYAEALELFWIQYVVAYDKREQSQLAGSLRKQWRDFGGGLTAGALALAAQFGSGWGGASYSGVTGSVILFAVLILVSLTLLLAARRFGWAARRHGAARAGEGRAQSVVLFYERMTAALAARGLRRAPDQTPLEFAATIGVPEALDITRAYHRVRYGARDLTPAEASEVERQLRRVEGVSSAT